MHIQCVQIHLQVFSKSYIFLIFELSFYYFFLFVIGHLYCLLLYWPTINGNCFIDVIAGNNVLNPKASGGTPGFCVHAKTILFCFIQSAVHTDCVILHNVRQ